MKLIQNRNSAPTVNLSSVNKGLKISEENLAYFFGKYKNKKISRKM